MKIVAISDLHGNLPEIPSCDLLLLAGDLCPLGDHSLANQSKWLDSDFRDWLCQQPAKEIIGVAGNHDLVFEQRPDLVPDDLPWTYLQDAETRWEGFKIWGTPWQLWWFGWAFNKQLEEIAEKWALIPPSTDILVCHGPPRGYGDEANHGETKVPSGCPYLLERIKAIKPRLVVFGHIHEGRGEWKLGTTRLANVSLVNQHYKVVHQPWAVEIEANTPW